MKKFTLITLVLSLWTITQLHAGQLALKDDNPNEQVQVRVIYHFSQKAIKDREPIIITDTMALDMGNNWSVYYDWNKARRDSLSEANFRNNPPKRVSLRFSEDELQQRLDARNQIISTIDRSKGERARIYKYRTSGKVFIFDDAPNNQPGGNIKYFKLTENIPSQNWQILNDTATILGYTCMKATSFFRGRIYNAWFTLDIPINDGPWKLYGLPGLILKVEENNQVFIFEAIGIQETKNEIIHFPTDREIINCESLKDIKLYRKNQFKDVSIGFSDGEGGLTYYNIKNPVTFNELELE